jgi:hypothetical protein
MKYSEFLLRPDDELIADKLKFIIWKKLPIKESGFL